MTFVFFQAGAEAAFVCTAAAFFEMRPSEVRTPKMATEGEKKGVSEEQQKGTSAAGGGEDEESDAAAGDYFCCYLPLCRLVGSAV